MSLEAGFLLRKLQRGESVPMPHARPMPTIGRRCCELRVVDRDSTWRIVCRLDDDAIVIAEVFAKKTAKTPSTVIEICQKRLQEYDDA